MDGIDGAASQEGRPRESIQECLVGSPQAQTEDDETFNSTDGNLPQKGETPPKLTLHQIARNGTDRELCLAALKASESEMNEVDSVKKSVLFVAVEKNKSEAAKSLIIWNVDWDTVSGERTALGIAAMKSRSTRGMEALAYQMLDKGASPKAGMNQEVYSLLCASAAGETSKARTLLENSLKNSPSSHLVDSMDQLGHTALHVAAYFGRYEVANLLLDFGADIDAEVALGGKGVLHMIITRHPLCLYLDAVYQNRSAEHLRLTQNHATTMDLLLKHSASLSYKRKSDGCTVAEIVSGRLRGSSSTAERTILQQMLVILEHHCRKREDFIIHDNIIQPNLSRIVIRHYTPNGERLFMANMKYITPSEVFQESTQQLENGSWRWIHLPKCNRVLFEDTIKALGCSRFNPPGVNHHGSDIDAGACSTYRRACATFIHKMFREFDGLNPNWRTGESSALFPFKSHDDMFSILIPFIDAEDDQLSSVELATATKKRSLQFGSFDDYTHEVLETVITAFSDLHEHHEMDEKEETDRLTDYLIEAFKRDAPSRINSMILQMVREANKFAGSRRRNRSGRDILTTCEDYVFILKEMETQSYESLETSNQNALGQQTQTEDQSHITNTETRGLRRVREIEHELRELTRTYTSQKTVCLDGQRHAIDSGDWVDLSENLDGRISKAGKLLQDARMIEESLKFLLEIKHKRKNLKTAEWADARARTGESEKRLLFIFTFITVIFTPLSFICALLAVPSQNFPTDGEGNGSWSVTQIVIASVATEAATMLVIAVYWFTMKDVEEFKKWVAGKFLGNNVSGSENSQA